MKKYAAFVLFSLLFMLGGCKLEHNSRIKYSQLLGEIKTAEAVARVEVPSCTDYKNKSQPSEGLVKVNEMMAQLFPDSEFEGCKNENMKSMATYITPMEVGTLPPGTDSYRTNGVGIIRSQQGVTFFFLSKQIRDQIAKGRKDAMTKDVALHVSIRLTNDSEKEITLFPYAIFADGDPFAAMSAWDDTVAVKPKGTVALTLSDVASEYAIAKGIVPLFREPPDAPAKTQ